MRLLFSEGQARQVSSFGHYTCISFIDNCKFWALDKFERVRPLNRNSLNGSSSCTWLWYQATKTSAQQ